MTVRHWMGVAVAAGAAAVVLAWPTGSAACDRTIIDHAGALTASTRLVGIVQSLERDGLEVRVRTIASGASAMDRAASMAQECAALNRHDADAVVVVVNASAAEAAVLAVGSTSEAHARHAEALIENRLSSANQDVSSTVAQGLEQIWEGRADSLHAEGVASSGVYRNVWAAARRMRLLTTAALVFVAVLGAWAIAGAVVSRRSATAAAVRDAQRARRALIDGYLEVDAAVVQALRQQGTALPAAGSDLIDEAVFRAGEAILATAGHPVRGRSSAERVAATCAAACDGLRHALALATAEASQRVPRG